MVLFGLVMTLKGPTYKLGTLMHMGPGFMPTVLGVILIFIGIAIAGVAAMTHEPDQEAFMPDQPQWWGWACILAGPLMFMLVGDYFGLAPAIFACVFVSALGDREATWKGTFGLAIVVTIVGVALFSYLLQVPMPVLEWRGR